MAGTTSPWRATRYISSLLRSSPTTCLRAQARTPLHARFSRPRWQSTRPNPDPTPNLGSPEPNTLSARMKRLSREYGWSALGVYLILSAMDFPFCYLAVRWLGAERIGRYEHAVMGSLWHLLEVPFPNLRPAVDHDAEAEAEAQAREGTAVAAKDDASIWTQLALAYAVHKSLIFFRVPLTAAVTPRVVKTLRGWGWDIARKKPLT